VYLLLLLLPLRGCCNNTPAFFAFKRKKTKEDTMKGRVHQKIE
jgi:hypothetical protein